LGLKK